MASDNPSAAEVQKFLKGVEYPATKSDLRKVAEAEGADDRVMDFLMEIPNKNYARPTEVEHELHEYVSREDDMPEAA